MLAEVNGIVATPGNDGTSEIRALAGRANELSSLERPRLFDALANRATRMNNIAAMRALVDQLASLHAETWPRGELAPLVAKLLRAVDPGEIGESRQLRAWIGCIALAKPDAQTELLERLRDRMPGIERQKAADGTWDVSRALHWLIRSSGVEAAAKATVLALLGKEGLVRAELHHCHLTAPAFQEWDLSHSIFDRATLVDADFRRATLVNTSFRDTQLRGAKFEGTSIDLADFTGANLSGADFRHLRYNIDSDASPRISLRRANLTGADFRDAQLEFFDLSDADLTSADLRGTNPPPSFLTMRCLLTNARLDASFVARLDEQLANAKPDLSSSRVRDLCFNHLHNGGRSVLATIDSLPAEYNAHKVRMVENLLRGLLQTAASDMDVGDVSSSVADVLTRDPIYRQSGVCDEFLFLRSMQTELERCQTQVVTQAPNAGWLGAMMRYIAVRVQSGREDEARNGAMDASRRAWVREHGFGIFQVFSLASEHAAALEQAAAKNPTTANAPRLTRQAADLKAQAKAIRNDCMKIAGTSDGRSPQDIEALVQIADDDLSEDTFPVFSADGRHALLLTSEYLKTCGRGTDGSPKPWSQGYALQPQQQNPGKNRAAHGEWQLVSVQDLDVRAVLKVAPPLRALYVSENRTEVMKKCLELILPQPYAQQALRERDMAHRADGDGKWVVTGGDSKSQHSDGTREQEVKVQEDLSKRVKSLTRGEPFRVVHKNRIASREPSSDYLLNENFYADLIAANADLVQTGGRVDPMKAAYFCRCWAAVLAGLSNSHHFGTETASPESVRYLALAFLNQAGRLSESSGGWKNIQAAERLIGTEFSCTSVVFDAMRSQLLSSTTNPALQEIYQALIPSAW